MNKYKHLEERIAYLEHMFREHIYENIEDDLDKLSDEIVNKDVKFKYETVKEYLDNCLFSSYVFSKHNHNAEVLKQIEWFKKEIDCYNTFKSIKHVNILKRQIKEINNMSYFKAKERILDELNTIKLLNENKEINNSSKPTVYLLCGMPGSGKSSFTKTLPNDVKIISRDIIRAELGYTESPDEKAVLSHSSELQVTNKERHEIRKALENNQNICIDDTNIVRKNRKQIIKLLREYDCNIIGVNKITDLETCIKRRENQIPEDVMRNMYARYSPISSDEDVDNIINIHT